MLVFSIILMFAALSFYSAGVWGEKLAGGLNRKFLLLFWAGFAFDTIGTTLMGKIADGFQMNLHGATGLAAIILMFIHAVWATIVIAMHNEKMKQNFHKFSIVVWIFWLIPFISGIVMNAF